MHHSNYILDFLWNDHSWYTINSFDDFSRAILWCLANLVTAFAYYGIPWEIWQWRKQLPFYSSAMVGLLFISFIIACGTHHIVDVIIMPTAPWWAVLWVNIPMAAVSLATWIYIRNNRPMILKILQGILKMMEANKKLEDIKTLLVKRKMEEK